MSTPLLGPVTLVYFYVGGHWHAHVASESCVLDDARAIARIEAVRQIDIDDVFGGPRWTWWPRGGAS